MPHIPSPPIPLPIHPSVTGQATWSEVEDAVRGWLRPRVIKGSFNQDIRNPGFIGLETGLPVALAWCWVFQQNEQCQIPDRLTDAQLLEQMLDDFPGMEFRMDVNIVRWKYNTGALTRGLVPIRKSHRYDSNGRVISAGWKGAVRRSVNRQKYSLQLKKEFEKCIELNEFVREFVHKPRPKPTPLFENRHDQTN